MAVVKDENVANSIKSLEFVKLGQKTTVGICTLVNGFEIVESSCVDPAKYNEAVGQKIVRERINHRIWEMLGFKAQDTNAATTEGQQPTEVSDSLDEFEGEAA